MTKLYQGGAGGADEAPRDYDEKPSGPRVEEVD